MKIRTGFVSNSSTSSFCLYGICIEKDELQKKILKLSPKLQEKYKKMKAGETVMDDDNEYELTDYNLDYELEEFASKVLAKHDLVLQSAGEYDEENYYVGRYWSSVGNKETGQQFKDSTSTSLKETLGKSKCSTHEMAYQS